MDNMPTGVQLADSGKIRIRWWYKGRALSATVDLPHTAEGIQQAMQIRKARMQETQEGTFYLRVNVDNQAGICDPPDLSSAYKTMFKSAKKRREYTLSSHDEQVLIDRAGGLCELTHIPLSADRGKYNRGPFRPSLDRIDSHKGYTIENCRIVCCAVNLAMNEWGEDVLEAVAIGYLRRHGTASFC